MRILTFLAFSYLILFLTLKVIFFGPQKANNATDYESYASLVENSDVYDGLRICIKHAEVIRSGHFFYGLFFISYYEVETFDGAVIPVFTRKALPKVGRQIEIGGVFRQYLSTVPSLYGITEERREYLEPVSGID